MDNELEEEEEEDEREEDPKCRTGDYSSVSGDCGAFTVCKDGVLYKKRCATGLHFVGAKNSCDWPENSDCQDGGHGGDNQVSTDVSRGRLYYC